MLLPHTMLCWCCVHFVLVLLCMSLFSYEWLGHFFFFPEKVARPCVAKTDGRLQKKKARAIFIPIPFPSLSALRLWLTSRARILVAGA